MKTRLFIVSVLSMFMFACGKSDDATETTSTDVVAQSAEVVNQAPVTTDVTKTVEEGAAVSQAAAVPVKTANASGGEAVYKKACMSCHMTGAAGAPKLGDASAWELRIAKGSDALVQSALAGVPGTAMMAKGACNACSDDDIKSAVEYMIAQSR